MSKQKPFRSLSKSSLKDVQLFDFNIYDDIYPLEYVDDMCETSMPDEKTMEHSFYDWQIEKGMELRPVDYLHLIENDLIQ